MYNLAANEGRKQFHFPASPKKRGWLVFWEMLRDFSLLQAKKESAMMDPSKQPVSRDSLILEVDRKNSRSYVEVVKKKLSTGQSTEHL